MSSFSLGNAPASKRRTTSTTPRITNCSNDGSPSSRTRARGFVVTMLTPAVCKLPLKCCPAELITSASPAPPRNTLEPSVPNPRTAVQLPLLKLVVCEPNAGTNRPSERPCRAMPSRARYDAAPRAAAIVTPPTPATSSAPGNSPAYRGVSPSAHLGQTVLAGNRHSRCRVRPLGTPACDRSARPTLVQSGQAAARPDLEHAFNPPGHAAERSPHCGRRLALGRASLTGARRRR
jgi:hypothetical protein